MKLLVTYILVQFIFSHMDTLVLINDKVITKNDFLRRSEYTIRPVYCNSDNNIDKKIILNSLIAEKLFAIENFDFEIKDKKMLNSINGIKEQTMRKVMIEEHVNDNLFVQKEKLNDLYQRSLFKYDISFIVIKNFKYDKFTLQGSLLDIAENLNLSPSFKEISFFNCDNNEIFNYFYFNKNDVNKGDLIGPIILPNNEAILVQVAKKISNVSLNQLSQIDRYKRIEDYYVEYQSSILREEFVHKVMKGKQIVFEDDVFINLANYFYSSDSSIKIDSDKILFILDEKHWKISDIIDINNNRPLVFRDSYTNKIDFYEQFKFALVDLVRDFYLTNKAYSYGYDNHSIVVKEVEVWTDYMLAYDMKNQVIANGLEIKKYNNEYDLIRNVLTPKSEDLFKKYSDNIIVDVDMFNDIKLSGIDMVVINANQPYQLLVPLFPKLTMKNNLNYGIKKPT